MTNRGELFARLDRIENRIIGDIDKRAKALNPSDRQYYDNWRAAQRNWLAKHETMPGGAYSAMLNDNEPPRLSSHLILKLFKTATNLSADVSLRDIQDEWQKLIR